LNRKAVRYLLFFFLLLFVVWAIAALSKSMLATDEWVKVYQTHAGTIFISPSHVESYRHGVVKAWWLLDRKKAATDDGKSFLSFKAQEEYSCGTAQYKALKIVTYSSHMGTGDETEKKELSYYDKWYTVIPDSDAEKRMKAACKEASSIRSYLQSIEWL
jgi:hypothetical protein